MNSEQQSFTQLDRSFSSPSNEEIISSSVNLCKIRNEFVCLICHGAVYNPLECPECATLFCRVCLRKWQILDPRCPACRRDTIFQIPSRVLLSILSSERISGCPFKRCQKSQRRMSYQEIIKHFKTECEFLYGMDNSDSNTWQADCTTDTSYHYKQVQLQQCKVSITSNQESFSSFKLYKLTELIKIDHQRSTIILEGTNPKDLEIQRLKDQMYVFQQMLHDSHDTINELVQEISRLTQYENLVNENEQMRPLVKNGQIQSDGHKHASRAEQARDVTTEPPQIIMNGGKRNQISNERKKKSKVIKKTKKPMQTKEHKKRQTYISKY